MEPLDDFRAMLDAPDLHRRLRAGLIGEDAMVPGPHGAHPMLYADYTASGRALRQVEEFILTRVLPFYANTHTQASHCGAVTTRLREALRAEIARITGADDGTSVIFTGAGSTSGINRIVALLDLPRRVASGEAVTVLVGPYEHHSNLLPWRESGAEVIEIPEAEEGGPDLGALERTLKQTKGAIVGAFGAASNVTGTLTDDRAVTQLLKAHGALAIWDYGCAGPYVPMTMDAGTDHAKDAIVFSPHKFAGGPGASGLLILNDSISRRSGPTQPGGGTVAFVSPWDHVWSDSLTDREEAGTPNVIGDIRAGLAMLVKEAMGTDWQSARLAMLRARALAAWRDHPRIELLGKLDAPALPIFSFRVRDGAGGYVHHQLFTRMLSDIHGIQARGGCACAGSYGHRLLGLDRKASARIVAALEAGLETEKPGWVRLNFSALMTDTKADFLIDAVSRLALEAASRAVDYVADPAHARFMPRHENPLAPA